MPVSSAIVRKGTVNLGPLLTDLQHEIHSIHRLWAPLATRNHQPVRPAKAGLFSGR